MTDELIVSTINGTGSLLSNIFEHKIRIIKDYFLDKELAKDIEPENISETLRLYFDRLSSRVSEITTVAFPQHKLDFIKLYEPLRIIKIKTNDDINETALPICDDACFDIVNKLKSESGAYIIIDSAGMGKTTFSRYLVHETLYKSDKIPILFDLRKTNETSDLIELLAKELDFPWKKFSRDVFYRLLATNKFIIILDGFDEVTPSNQEYISEQIHALSRKCCNNSILLTSRPQEGLPDLINSRLLKFAELDLEQVKSLLIRYDNCASSNVGKNLIEQLDKVPSNFLKTPLIVSLLYKTFGFNNSIADRLCTFYDDVYQALYKGHDLINKGGFCRKKLSNLDYEDFRKLVRGLSYLMTISRVVSFSNKNDFYAILEKAIKLTNVTPSSQNNFLTDLLVSVPLMVKEGNEYKFIHKTILEYFSAEYLVYHPTSKDKLSLILRSEHFSYYSKVIDFVYDINMPLYDNVITKHLAITAREKTKENDLLSNIVNSCALFSDFYMGVFEKTFVDAIINDKQNYFSMDAVYEEKESFAIHIFFNEYNSKSYMSQTNEILIDGDVYFFAIAKAQKEHIIPFHYYAYEKICQKYTTTELNDALGIDQNEVSDNIKKSFHSDLLDSIKVNKWNLIQESEDYFSWGKKLIIDGIVGSLFINQDGSHGHHAHILSKEKIDDFLDKLDREDSLEREIEMLI